MEKEQLLELQAKIAELETKIQNAPGKEESTKLKAEMAKKIKLGLVDSSYTYTGKDADEFYSTVLLTGNSKALFKQFSNVKNKINVPSMDMGSFLQEDACSLDASGNYTLDTKELSVCDVGFKVPFCVKDWEPLFLSELMRPGSNVEANYPNGIVDYIFDQMKLKISADLENITFQGDTAGSPAALCDGLQKKLLADGTVLDVTVDGTKLHESANVIGELKEMYERVPSTIKFRENLRYMVNPATAAAYKLALAATHPAIYAYNNGNFGLNFMDIPMVVCPGLGDYKAILCDPQNLWFACDLMSDEMQIDFTQDPLNKKTHYATGSFKVGFGFGVGAEIVYYN